MSKDNHMYKESTAVNGNEQEGRIEEQETSNSNGQKEETASKILEKITSTLSPVDPRKDLNLRRYETTNVKSDIVMTVDYVVEAARSIGFSLCHYAGSEYLFDGRYWRSLDGTDFNDFAIQSAICMGIEPHFARHYGFAKEWRKQFCSIAAPPTSTDKACSSLINLRNGTIEVSGKSWTIREARREDFLRYVLPFEYDEIAVPKRWLRFLGETLPNEGDQRLLQEFLAYIFTTLKLEKVLILLGPGGNGKSVVFDVVKAFLGKDHLSHLTPIELSKDTNRYQLSGKLLNYSSEAPSKFDMTLFKQLVSGEPISARKLYSDVFTLSNYGRFAFNCNELPSTPEHTDAFFRRLMILPFLTKIPEERRDPELASKIIASELPGILNWVLEGLTRLLSNRKFSVSQSAEEILSRYRLESDNVAMFLHDRGYKQDSKALVGLTEIFEDYRGYCREVGEPPLSQRYFRSRLESLGYTCPRLSSGRIVRARLK